MQHVIPFLLLPLPRREPAACGESRPLLTACMRFLPLDLCGHTLLDLAHLLPPDVCQHTLRHHTLDLCHHTLLRFPHLCCPLTSRNVDAVGLAVSLTLLLLDSLVWLDGLACQSRRLFSLLLVPGHSFVACYLSKRISGPKHNRCHNGTF